MRSPSGISDYGVLEAIELSCYAKRWTPRANDPDGRGDWGRQVPWVR